jgi:hypothetical protein
MALETKTFGELQLRERGAHDGDDGEGDRAPGQWIPEKVEELENEAFPLVGQGIGAKVLQQLLQFIHTVNDR